MPRLFHGIRNRVIVGLILTLFLISDVRSLALPDIAQDPDKIYDVAVHIRDLFVGPDPTPEEDPFFAEYEPDPYVVIIVDGQRQKTITQCDLSVEKHESADKLICKHFFFRFFDEPPKEVTWLVFDEDSHLPWNLRLPDKMAGGEEDLSFSPKECETMVMYIEDAEDCATIKLIVETHWQRYTEAGYIEPCWFPIPLFAVKLLFNKTISWKLNLTGLAWRGFKNEASVVLEVLINPNITTTVTIAEHLPLGYTLVSSEPPAQVIITPIDGDPKQELLWTISSNTTINYNLRANFIYEGQDRTIGGIIEGGSGWKNATISGCPYLPAWPVGGIGIPVDKLALLAPYFGLASTILVATVATSVYAKHVKRRKEKQ